MEEIKKQYTKFVVMKVKYAEDCLSFQQIKNLKDILATIQEYRREIGKNPNPTYYVINTDEHYADQIKAIIEKNEIGEAE